MLKLPHWLQLVFSFLVVAIAWVIAQDKSGALSLSPSVLAGVLTAAKLLDTIIGLTTDSVQTTGAKARALAASTARTLGVLSLLAIAGLALPSCKGPIFPTLENLGTVVLADLEAVPPASDAKLSADVCSALGGSSTTDAICATVGTVLDAVIVLLENTGQLNGHPVALKRVAAYHAAHPALAPKAGP